MAAGLIGLLAIYVFGFTDPLAGAAAAGVPAP
jgi:hypothetical protein